MKKTIGNTPLIKINYTYKNKLKSIYTKLEYYNLTGSIKDRMTEYILKEAYKDRELIKDMPIVEATSGNTGISLAALGAFYKNPIYIFMPDWCSEERKKIMEAFGAKVFLVSREEGGFTECIKRADALARQLNGYRPNQFSNRNNIEIHYLTTAREIIDDLKNINIGGFIAGVGTGGTLMGIGKKLKENNPNIVIAALEPDKLPIISQGTILGNHKIEGIGDDFIPDLVDRNSIDDVILITDEDAINMSKLLAQQLGLGVGISSGANMLGAILLQDKIDKEVVTVFPDDNKKYLSTDLSRPINKDLELVSNQVAFIDYEIINNK